MDYVKLVTKIVESIADAKVKEEDGIIKIYADEENFETIVGKSGNTIDAIRTLLDEAASMHGDSFKQIEVEKEA